jgi:hypothetical protein
MRFKEMQLLFIFCQWLENTAVGTSVRESVWEFPVIETVHLFGIILLVGSSSILDLRLMGLAFKGERVSKLAHRTLPWAWTGIVIEAVTGFLLFASEATKLSHNHAFQLKIMLILLAGMNVLVFHSLAYRSVGTWDEEVITPISARLAGSLSLLLWVAIVSAGIWTPYF